MRIKQRLLNNKLIEDIITYIMIAVVAFTIGFVLRDRNVTNCEKDSYSLFLKLRNCENTCK